MEFYVYKRFPTGLYTDETERKAGMQTDRAATDLQTDGHRHRHTRARAHTHTHTQTYARVLYFEDTRHTEVLMWISVSS